jgi:hypothetical protein
MKGGAEFGPIPDEYACLLEDVMRLAAMHAAIHMMLVCENNGERLFDRRAVAMLLYALLGIAFYHLIVRRIIVIKRSDERKHCPGWKQ